MIVVLLEIVAYKVRNLLILLLHEYLFCTSLLSEWCISSLKEEALPKTSSNSFLLRLFNSLM